MKSRVHNSPNLIYSVGTQVVALKHLQGSNGQTVHPAGAVGVVARSPRDRSHSYRVRYLQQADVRSREREHQRLTAELQQAAATTGLPERPSGRAALNSLLVRLRLRNLA